EYNLTVMRNFLLAALLCIAVISCDKDDLPDAPGDTLSKIDYDIAGAAFSETLVYDIQKRLIQFVGNTGTFDLTYNAQGQLSGAIYKQVPSGVVIRTFQFAHDPNGRIIKRTITSSSGTTDRYYKYDVSGKVIADSQYNITPYTRAYTYDTRGNVIKMEQTSYTGSAPATIRLFTYRYDNKLTPYHKVRSVLFYISDLDFLSSHLSASNIIGSTMDGVATTRNYFYEYYSNGLMHTTIYNDPQPFNGSARIRYTFVQ
ncbi:MAG TPA: hypothetical protein VHM26_11480, partial [Chitinophagaceae bacterium]|nr:hypothetical protein [Chitinophagaceae bacterium]